MPTEPNPAAASAAPLYSQTEFDERGNFHYQGDLQQPGESLAAIVARVDRHLRACFPDTRFAMRTQTFSGGRKIIADLLDTPEDLTGRDAQQDFSVKVKDQIERFGFTRSNIYQDSHHCAFFCEVTIGQAYWAALAKRRRAGSMVDSVVSLAAFKRRIKPGDQMKLISAPGWYRSIGTTRAVQAVRSKDIILEGPSYLTLPRAAQFACDGKLVRIAIGTEDSPDAHLLYQWTPAKAA
ncbi:hypothetical protein SAMN06295912_11290 [Sphingomonas laterariae]|uniref:Uncharacterized protein n=1 Tax=Edaphosphingomonas laterariae TaxID=861865 RepID=A0A239GJC2_9SPHN|nr:hypothetical protein [Sphingomonas laterariae]SNS68902.1 hypothetical protein SAMN06295912_11290 [Sphingomonas laterariae]